MITLTLMTALAAPSGYTETKTGNGCTLYKGAAGSDGVVPIYADCHWPEVAPAKLHGILDNWPGHATVFSTVETSKVVKTEGGTQIVQQVHNLSGISNREVQFKATKKSVDKGFEYGWMTANDGLVIDKSSVLATRHEGYWRITDHPDGGTRAEHGLTYNPGGSVPGFMVRMFQTSGVLATTEELRAAGVK